MNWFFRTVIARFYFGLLSLYPNHFRSAFGDEIRNVFLDVVDEASETGEFKLLTTSIRELKSLLVSIIREHWHALKSRGAMEMASDNGSGDASVLHSERILLVKSKPPGWSWVVLWTMLMTVAILAGWLLMAPFTVIIKTVLNLGTRIGILPDVSTATLEPVGLFIGLGVAFAAFQWLMLRHYLPRMKFWLLATTIGFFGGGIFVGSVVPLLDTLNVDNGWSVAIYFLLTGASVGFWQWITLRRFLDNAFWILVIDIIAAGSIFVSGNSFTNLYELFVSLMLPGLVTGVGLWLLLKQSRSMVGRDEKVETPAKPRRLSKKALWALLGLGSLIPLFFLLSWIFAVSQIELAKSRGIYATPEEAVIALNSQGWGGAQVVKIVGVHASPNRKDGSQPHVWFGGGTVYLDRVPQGWNRTQYLAGSFYIHVKDGWVHVPEGAFPEFVGWVMELYDLEEVNEWIVESE